MKFRKIMNNGVWKLINAFVITLVIQSANSACMWMFYQPDFPKGAEKYRRIKG